MSRLLVNSYCHARIVSQYAKKNVIVGLAARQQRVLMSTSGGFVSSHKNDFRQIGTEKDAGALQDLLRRVMEVDAGITNTPIVEYKPKTQHCVGYCVADAFDIQSISSKLSSSSDFRVTSDHSFSNMIHILDHAQGGDIYVFSNGTFVCWGLDQSQQEKFLNDYVRNCGGNSPIAESTESVEYIIDEDEVTDIKGDVILLNPYVPSIDLSKVAFSYGLGRAAKLTSIEKSLDDYLTQFEGLPYSKEKLLGKSAPNPTELLYIRQRMVKGSHDGFLGTQDFHWTRPELQDYVKKLSSRFDVYTRIQILNKKIEYASDATNLLSTGGVVSN